MCDCLSASMRVANWTPPRLLEYSSTRVPMYTYVYWVITDTRVLLTHIVLTGKNN